MRYADLGLNPGEQRVVVKHTSDGSPALTVGCDAFYLADDNAIAPCQPNDNYRKDVAAWEKATR